MTDEQVNDDIEFEAEDAPENNVHEKLLAKVAKLKSDLEACNAERQEYLDGWQRMRADVANMKRDQAASFGQTQALIKEEIIADFIPILDSFDSAMQGEAWNDVSESWRKGIEYIRTQCESVLDKHGVKPFGAIGELFNPALHEAAQEVGEASATHNTILRIIRKGYKSGDRIIRPAQVVISK